MQHLAQAVSHNLHHNFNTSLVTYLNNYCSTHVTRDVISTIPSQAFRQHSTGGEVLEGGEGEGKEEGKGGGAGGRGSGDEKYTLLYWVP